MPDLRVANGATFYRRLKGKGREGKGREGKGSLAEELERREAAAEAEAERLRARVEELSAELARVEEQVARLVITREEVAQGLARGFAGLSADMRNRVRPIFVANIASDSVTKYLTGRKIDRELNVVPGAPEIEGVQHLIREAFKTHVGKGDPSYRM